MKLLLIVCAAALAACKTPSWSVQDAGGTTCIVLEAEPYVTVKFESENGTHVHTVAVNGSVTATGECHVMHLTESSEHIKLSFWPNGVPANVSTNPWTLEIFFGQKNEAFYILDYSVTTNEYDGIEGSEAVTFASNGTVKQRDVTAKGTNAFQCSTSQLPLVNSSNIEFKHLRLIAFAQLENATFPFQQVFEQCQLDSRTSDIVPIVVGACLAGLVILVLVAYLIGRARARRQGYASV